MKIVLQSLFFSFCHPFRFAAYIGGTPFISRETALHWRSLKIRPLTLGEILIISWVFKIISEILLLNFLAAGDYFLMVHPKLQVKVPTIILIFTTGFSIACFPLIQLLFWGACKWIIGVFGNIYLSDEEMDRHLDSVLVHSLSSNVMLAIPFVGSILQSLLWYLYLFAGLKNTFGLSPLRAIGILAFIIAFTTLCIIAVVLAVLVVFKV